MSILITGGAGFIGSHLAAHFLPSRPVRVLDDHSLGHRRNLAGRLLSTGFKPNGILARGLEATIAHLRRLMPSQS